MRLRFAHFGVLILLCAVGFAGCRSSGTAFNPPSGIGSSFKHLYIWSGTSIEIYNTPVTSSSTPTGAYPGVGGGDGLGLFVDSHQRLFVPLDLSPGTVVDAFTLPLTPSSTPAFTLTTAHGGVVQAAEDATGNVYVSTCDGDIDVFNGPVDSTRASPSYSFATPTSCPWGVAIAPNGDLYDEPENSTDQYTPPFSAASTPSAEVPTTHGNWGVTIDSNNRVFAADESAEGTVDVFTQPFTSVSTPAFTITVNSSKSVEYTAFDGSGNLWVIDGGGTLWKIAAPITSSSTATQVLTGITGPAGIAFGR